MDKIDIGTSAFPYPMPMTVVGAMVDGKPNFMPLAFVNRVRANPPWMMAAMNKNHHTNRGILENGEFSLNIPTRSMAAAVDYCGLHSGRNSDKSTVFDVFFGSLPAAPLISECPMCIECRLVKHVDLDSHDLFVAEVVGAWSEKRYLSDDGKPDIVAIDPLMLTMPDNRYWSVGDHVADAWSVGRAYNPLDT